MTRSMTKMKHADVVLEDSALQLRVLQALAASGYLAMRGISVDVQDRQITLHGIVGCFYEKQIAQAAAMAMDGVASLRNEIIVRS